VYQEGELASEMYFILTGEISFVLVKNENVIPYLTLRKDYYFGECAILFSEAKKHFENARSN
jgi:CRP-like cAMP-binding protein